MNRKNQLKARLKSNPKMLLDGSMGALLIARGFKGSNVYKANIDHPEEVASIHRSYFQAGSEMVLTNTFSITEKVLSYIGMSVSDVVLAGVNAAKEAMGALDDRHIALNLAPFGFMEPASEAKRYFADRIAPAADLVDCIFFETFSNSEELKIAIQTAREFTDAPIFASMTFNENMLSWSGENLTQAISNVAKENPDALGINCTIPPLPMAAMAEKLIDAVGGKAAVFAEPNRGVPEYIEGEAKYMMSPEEFADGVEMIYEKGIKILGGCCGSDDECIKLLHERIFS